MKINFLEIAQIELDDPIEYYNYELPGLGDGWHGYLRQERDMV